MSAVETFAWGMAAGYVLRGAIHAFEEIRKAQREAKAKIEEARRRYDRT